MHILETDRLVIDTKGLPASLVGDLKYEFEHKNPVHYRLKAQRLWPPKTEPPVIVNWREDDTRLSLPRGGLARVVEIFRRYKLYPAVVPNLTIGEQVDFPPPRVTPYEYQQRCIEAAIEKKIGIVKAPTGGGKTVLGVALIAQVGAPFLIVIHSVALLNQWKERIAAVFGDDYETGLIQGKSFYLKPVTLAMAQTLHKISDGKWGKVNSYFGGVIQDEVQMAAASTFLQSLDRCEAEYRIGLSADHTRKDRKEFLIHDTFGGVIAEISRTDLVSKSFVLDPHVVLKPTQFDAEWFLQQRYANELRNTGLDFDRVFLGMKARWPDMKMSEVPKGQPDYSRLIDEMCADPSRNAKIVSLTERMVHDGRRVFVFCHRVDHCDSIIRDLRGLGLKAGALIGGPENKKEFEQTIDGLQNGDLDVGVGTWQALGTGIDCPRVSGGIMATPISGKQIWGQIRGRLCRTYPGKSDAVLYYLWDRRVFSDSPVKNMNKWNTRCSIEVAVGDLESAKAYLRRNQ